MLTLTIPCRGAARTGGTATSSSIVNHVHRHSTTVWIYTCWSLLLHARQEFVDNAVTVITVQNRACWQTHLLCARQELLQAREIVIVVAAIWKNS